MDSKGRDCIVSQSGSQTAKKLQCKTVHDLANIATKT